MQDIRCYAAIDIGSNAVRLLIKRTVPFVKSGQKPLTKVLLLRIPLRLGFDVFGKGTVSEVKAKKLCRAMEAFKQLMKIYEVSNFRACATSAMRDAANGEDIIKRIYKKTGINIEIISGHEEAVLIYGNHIECMEDRSGNYIYVDVGGGSTEINLLSDGELILSKSYNLGTVRILSGAEKAETWQRIKNDLSEIADHFPNVNIIGSGGNINKLYKLAETKDKVRQIMTVESLRNIYERLKPLSPERRMEVFNLKADRADVIVPAAEIFIAVADATNAKFIHVPVIGLADGIIDRLYANDLVLRQKKSDSV